MIILKCHISIGVGTVCVTADKRSQLDGFMALMFTLIRRLKLKDKRTKSYNMNKKRVVPTANEIQLIRSDGKDILTL